MARCISFTLTISPSTRAATRDRKSTRLNSSHSQISYAVFCLKKKTSHFSRAVCLLTTSSTATSSLPCSPPSLYLPPSPFRTRLCCTFQHHASHPAYRVHPACP